MFQPLVLAEGEGATHRGRAPIASLTLAGHPTYATAWGVIGTCRPTTRHTNRQANKKIENQIGQTECYIAFVRLRVQSMICEGKDTLYQLYRGRCQTSFAHRRLVCMICAWEDAASLMYGGGCNLSVVHEKVGCIIFTVM